MGTSSHTTENNLDPTVTCMRKLDLGCVHFLPHGLALCSGNNPLYFGEGTKLTVLGKISPLRPKATLYTDL